MIAISLTRQRDHAESVSSSLAILRSPQRILAQSFAALVGTSRLRLVHCGVMPPITFEYYRSSSLSDPIDTFRENARKKSADLHL
jgi:hypothetical protein